MLRSSKRGSVDPERVNLVLSIDGEGVVSVVNCEAEVLQLTPKQLGELLTGLVKSVCSLGDGDETTEVILN
jgi:hypothetical protein